MTFVQPFTIDDITEFNKCRYWFYLDREKPVQSKRVPARLLFIDSLKIAVQRIHRGRFTHTLLEDLLDRIYSFQKKREERRIIYQRDVGREYRYFLKEGAAILRRYMENQANRDCVIKGLSEPWEAKIDGYEFTGVFDQIRKVGNEIYLLDLVYWESLPTATALRLNFRSAIQARAFREIYGVYPDWIGVYNLYEHRVYSRPQPIEPLDEREATIQYARWYNENPPLNLEKIRELTGNNRLRAEGKVYFNAGHQIGPGLNAVRMSEQGIEWIIKSVGRICEQMMTAESYYINPRYCHKCPHRQRCRERTEKYERIEMGVCE